MSNSTTGSKRPPNGFNKENLSKNSSGPSDSAKMGRPRLNDECPSMQITSDEINFLVFRYLQEAGESPFSFNQNFIHGFILSWMDSSCWELRASSNMTLL